MGEDSVTMRGFYRDVLYGGNGRCIYDSGWTGNAIVDRGRSLLAGFLKNDSTGGIQFLAVGRGRPEWDEEGPPAPGPHLTRLADMHPDPIPLADLSIAYLDGGGRVVDGPTMRLQVTATLEAGYPPVTPPSTAYPLREFGIFGRYNGVDYMINCVRHPVIHKDESSTLVRIIRLYL